MLHTPFSVPMGYDAPDGKGIYMTPTSKDAPSGWGEPRMDKEVTPWVPIKPGTKGGPHANVLVRKKGTGYKASGTRYFQKSGCITWWGPPRDTQRPAKGRHVLSYAGPKLRYFRDDAFAYGTAPEHNEIYYLGGYAGIAPGPVLGACIRKFMWTDYHTATTTERTFLVAVCYVNGVDTFYRRLWEYRTVAPERMTDAIREKQMQMYDFKENEAGWMLMGTIPKQTDAYAPETPWFFSKSGHAAACMRRRKRSFNNNAEEVTEDTFDRFKVTLSDNGEIDFTNAGNLPAMEYTERLFKTRLTHVADDHYEFSHTYEEDHVKVEIKLKGEQYVLCDYVDDELWYGKLSYDVSRRNEEYYVIGRDPATYEVIHPVNGNLVNISNNGDFVGPVFYDRSMWGWYGAPEDPPYVPAPANHEWTVWIGITETVRLYYGPEANPEANSIDLHYYDAGTSDEWAGNPRQPDNPLLYYYQFYTRWLRGFFDIRKLAFFSHDIHKYGLWQDPANSNADVTHKFKEALYREVNTSGEAYRSVKKTSTALVDFGWPRVDMEAWPESFDQTLTRTTYVGAWPDDNAQGDTQVPGSRTFYLYDIAGDLRNDWPTIDQLLYGTLTQVKGNGVCTEFDAIAFSLEVPDVEKEGEYVKIADIKPAGQPSSVIGFGETFYPVGAC